MARMDMPSKWKSVFKKQLVNPEPLNYETRIENHKESSAIMEEMKEIPTNFILGPNPSAINVSNSHSAVTTSSYSNIDQNNPTGIKKCGKKLNSDSLGAVEDLLQCPVCFDRLQNPRMMPCQHTFCLECLEIQLDYFENEDKAIKCPLCKLTVIDSAPRNLPTNLYIENLLRAINNSGRGLNHLEFSSPVVTFAPFGDQPAPLIQGPSSTAINPLELSNIQDTRCIKCETTCRRDNKCKHCKQIFCSVCWVAHMDELKEKLANILQQLYNTSNRFEHRIENYKMRMVELTNCIDKDIELRINELRQEREERIKRAEESVKNGERLAEDLKIKIIKAQDEITAHQKFKFDTLADNHEKVKTFLSLHRRASDLMTSVALWEPELTDTTLDERDNKQNFIYPELTEEDSWLYYRNKNFKPRIIAGRDVVQRPSGIVMDPWKKHLLIACPGTRQILVLDKKYRVHRRIQHRDMMSPQGVAFIEDFEELFVTDKWKHCIHVFNRKGDLLRQICNKGEGEGQLRSPEGIAVHPTRNLLYVADTGNDRIQILSPDGVPYGIIGPTGKSETVMTRTGLAVTTNATHLNQPTAVAVSESMIAVADCANHKIKIFDHDGNLIRNIGTPGSHKGSLRSPESVTIDLKGNLIIGDSGNSRIQIFSPQGNLVRVLGSKGNKEGEFGSVSGILIKDNLEIVVTDSKNYNVQIF